MPCPNLRIPSAFGGHLAAISRFWREMNPCHECCMPYLTDWLTLRRWFGRSQIRRNPALPEHDQDQRATYSGMCMSDPQLSGKRDPDATPCLDFVFDHFNNTCRNRHYRSSGCRVWHVGADPDCCRCRGGCCPAGFMAACASIGWQYSHPLRNARMVASNSRGLSACSQWPAPASLANRAFGNRARMGARCSGPT